MMGKRRKANCILSPGAIHIADLVELVNICDDCFTASSVIGFPSNNVVDNNQRWRNFSWRMNRRYSQCIIDWCTRAG